MKLDHNIHELLEKQTEAIETAERNCFRLKNLIKYGVPSVDDRLPSTTSSVIATPSGSGNNNKNRIIKAVTEEDEDYLFINKMENIINELGQPYKNVFIKLFINATPVKHIYNGIATNGIANENIYKIIRKGYQKIALMDADIEFSAIDFLNIKNSQLNIKKNKRTTKAKTKALLSEVASLCLCNKLKFDTSLNFIVIGQDLSDFMLAKVNYLFSIIAQLPKPEYAVVLDLMNNTIISSEKNSTFYYTLERALLTIALLHDDIDYNFSSFEIDLKLSSDKQSRKYVDRLKNMQVVLNI